MSKSFKDKRRREIDYEDGSSHRPNMSNRQRRHEKQFHNALKTKDLNTLIKYSEEEMD